MREWNLIDQVLRRIEQERRSTGAVRISAIRVRIGERSGVDPVALLELFERLAQGTVAQGAYIQIERIALEAGCGQCGSRFRVVSCQISCPYCGSRRTRIVAGEEFVLESLTVVTECDPSLTCFH
ncbi:MAG: hydrogenase maturation nickel metallochaperone HypA [Isosphaeraceae bacterium]